MQTLSKATWVSIAIVVTIAVSLHLWTWLEPACHNEQRRIVMKLSGGVGCFEFWLNRYQSLLGAIAAVAAALIAWIAVSTQIGVQREANAISEISFWQAKIDAANDALFATTIARANVRRLRQEVEAAPGKGAPLISALNRLMDSGRLPLPQADGRAIGPLGVKYQILANLIDNMVKSDLEVRRYNALMDAELRPRMSLESLEQLEKKLSLASELHENDLDFASDMLVRLGYTAEPTLAGRQIVEQAANV